MVKVECGGCKAPYQIDEKRIPPAGLKMRCPKCGNTLLVTRPGADVDADADLPMPAPPRQPAAPRAIAAPPAAKAPTPPPPPPVDEEVVDLPSISSGPRKKAFGEIDLGTPQPPPTVRTMNRPNKDVPGAPPSWPGMAAAPPSPPASSPAKGLPTRGSGAFGEIDLLGELIAPIAGPDEPAQGGFGDDDLPVVRGRATAREVQGADMATAFGAIDLPAVHGEERDLPSRPSAPSDLPAIHGGRVDGKPRGRTVPFGVIDLADDAPPAAPRARADAPPAAPRARADAPPAAPRARAPSPLDARDLPSLASKDVQPPPAPRRGGQRGTARAFGEIDLPLIPDEEELPMPAQHAGLPVPAPGGALPMPAQTSGLPAPAPGGALPMPAQTSGLPAPAPGGALPMPAQASGLPAPIPFHIDPGSLGGSDPDPFGRSGDADMPLHRAVAPEEIGEELSLAPSSGQRLRARSAFEDADYAIPAHVGPPPGPMGDALAMPDSGRGSVGDEVELSSDPASIGDVSLPPRTPRARAVAAEPEAPPRRSNRRRIVVGAAVLLAVGGASLAFEPSIGPFGASFISDQLNAKKHAAALDELRLAAQADLREDTAAAAGRALDKAKAAQAGVPRHRPTAAYCAYVALGRGIRFGRRSEDEALARQLIAAARREPGDALALATAAEALGSGKPAEAREILAPLLQRAPDDPDAQALSGEIELRAGDAGKALAVWRQAATGKGGKSARALFGFARAQAAAGDAAGAEASARAAIEASPLHTGARVLLAGLTWQRSDREEEALAALKKVTEDPAVRGAASDAEIVEALTLLGRVHLTRSRFSAAEQAFAAALKLDPQAVEALIGNGELFYHAGRYSEASARFEAAMRADDGRVGAKIGAAKTWLALERMKDAKDLLKKLREAHPTDPRVAYWVGRVEEALGNKKEAEAAHSDAIKVGKDNPVVVDAYVALARLLSGVGRTDDANQKLLEASQRFPDLPALHRAKGELMLQTGHYEEAKAELSAALDKEDDLGARFKLGIAYRRLRSFDEAAAIFDKIAAVDKDYPNLALERGVLFEETGQSARALEMYSAALREAPDDVDLKLRVGSTQVIAGHADQAEATLREVVKARPSSAEANHFLGRALLFKRKPQEAMRFLENAVNIDGNRAEYQLYVGWCANEAANATRAEAALNKAIELDHELAEAYWQRGVMLSRQGRTADALVDLTTAVEKRPSLHDAYATMAICYQDQQRWAEAEKAFQRAIAGNGSVAEWHYRLGKLYATQGKAAAAGPELLQAVKLAEASDAPPSFPLEDAHFRLAEVVRGRDRDQAIQSYRRFLALAKADNPYIEEARQALASMGAGTEGR